MIHKKFQEKNMCVPSPRIVLCECWWIAFCISSVFQTVTDDPDEVLERTIASFTCFQTSSNRLLWNVEHLLEAVFEDPLSMRYLPSIDCPILFGKLILSHTSSKTMNSLAETMKLRFHQILYIL